MLSHGQRITKREFEIATSYWSPDEFASLCNAVVWASTRRQGTVLPSFTERVYVKDKGIDAEYITLDAEVGSFSPFIGAGWTVLQYKQRDIQAQNRTKIVSDLKSELKKSAGKELEHGKKEYYGALKDVYERNGKRPSRYILFTNIDLTHKQKEELKAIILEGYDQPETVEVIVNGAADLAAFLNDLPHLRSAYFVPSRFSSWEQAWKSHVEEKLSGASVELIGRGPQLTILESYLHDSSIRAMILTGPTGVGKSRLALEATKSYQTETIIAIDPTSMTVNDLLNVESPGAETIVIIDDPDPRKAEEFVRHILSRHELKLVITLPTSEHILAPHFGHDERVSLFPLENLTDQQARELLKVAGAKFDFGIESWIIAQANGIPEVLLVASSVPDLRKSTSSFIDDVATTFEYKIRRELGDRAVEVLRVVSLLIRVDIRGPFYKELATISSLLNDIIQPNDVLNEIPRLQRAGVVRVRGGYAEATPTLLANHLAQSALRGRYPVIERLFVALKRPARFYLIERLREIESVEVAHFWDELFSATGLFAEFQAALSNIQLLHALSGAASGHVARLLENGLGSLSVEKRASISGDARRYLMSILHELLFRKSTSKSALRCIVLLAESEVSANKTSSLETFYDCFHPFQPQCPLPLEDRVEILRKALSVYEPISWRVCII